MVNIDNSQEIFDLINEEKKIYVTHVACNLLLDELLHDDEFFKLFENVSDHV